MGMEKDATVYCIRLVSFTKPQSQIGALCIAVRLTRSKRYVTTTTASMPRKTMGPE
ncbi:MAG: hypothetical protein QMD06_04400 [Candidatus Altarchaeum sp.]|nr:hypothetical protein [Candidatus Altarchaeum sp.]